MVVRYNMMEVFSSLNAQLIIKRMMTDEIRLPLVPTHHLIPLRQTDRKGVRNACDRGRTPDIRCG